MEQFKKLVDVYNQRLQEMKAGQVHSGKVTPLDRSAADSSLHRDVTSGTIT